MTLQDTSRRLPAAILTQDMQALKGIKTISGYKSNRPGSSLKELEATYQAILTLQQSVIDKESAYKAAIDDLKQTEWRFHNSILEMKDVVRGQYGSDSLELQTVGIKRKSSRRRPTPKHKTAIETNTKVGAIA
jgi:hypothetical protein